MSLLGDLRLVMADGRAQAFAMQDEYEPDYSPDDAQGERTGGREEESSGAEEVLEEVRRSRRRSTEEDAGDKSKGSGSYYIPERVREVLRAARTFNDFKKSGSSGFCTSSQVDGTSWVRRC